MKPIEKQITRFDTAKSRIYFHVIDLPCIHGQLPIPIIEKIE